MLYASGPQAPRRLGDFERRLAWAFLAEKVHAAESISLSLCDPTRRVRLPVINRHLAYPVQISVLLLQLPIAPLPSQKQELAQTLFKAGGNVNRYQTPERDLSAAAQTTQVAQDLT